MKSAFEAVEVQLPLTVIVLLPAEIVPDEPIVNVPAVTVMARFDVASTVLPDGIPAEFCTVNEFATSSPLVAIVYVGPELPAVSSTRL